MAAEFRQRSVGEFWQMIKRRLWLIALPTIAVGIAVSWVVVKLPDMFESKTSLTLKPPTISTKVVESLSEEDLSQSLQTMNQLILSRLTLEPMVSKYKLFEPERAAGMDMGLIIDKMRKNIVVEPEKADNEKWTGFRLSYKDRTPDAARNVAAELASKYVNAQMENSTENAEKTREFIDNQVNAAKANLDALDQQRMQIMTQNSETLPEGAASLMAQLQGLRSSEDRISKEKETLIVQKGGLYDSIRLLNGQINIAESAGAADVDVLTKQSDPKDTVAYGQLVQQRATLTAKLENLKKQYTPKHPEVIETQTQIDKINDEISDLLKSSQTRASAAAQQGSRRVEIQKKNIELEKQKAESQIASIEQQIALKEDELRQNSAQVAELTAKLNQIPNVRVALEAVNNQYQMAKTTYDEFQKKKNDAQMTVDRNINAQGETIRVVDPANLPAAPVNASKKPLFMGMGVAVGLALGLFLAALFEVPRLLKIQNIEDAKHYTGLPVLASVPPLLTTREKSWQKRSHWMKVLVGIVVAFGSIPLVIMLLQTTKLLERLVS